MRRTRLKRLSRFSRRPGSGAQAPDPGLSTHILPTSATMVGVCMTVLAISLLAPADYRRTLVDKLVAIDSLVFPASGLLSFTSMRRGRRVAELERRAEAIFLTGPGLLALSAVVLTCFVD